MWQLYDAGCSSTPGIKHSQVDAGQGFLNVSKHLEASALTSTDASAHISIYNLSDYQQFHPPTNQTVQLQEQPLIHNNP